MPSINQLTRSTQLSAGDLLPLFSTSNGDARAAAISLLQEYMQDNLTFASGISYTTQYAGPNANAFSVAVTPGSANIHLILTPSGGFSNGTIVLPAVAGLIDKQEVLVNCTQSVTTLSIGLNGAAAAVGAPTTLAANAFFRLKYNLLTTNWYRVG
jgi:hypothetical protein